jgi:hypothetical protein
MIRPMLVAAVLAMACAACAPAAPESRPFTWSGLTWCPTYQGYSCTSAEQSYQYTVSFSPAQVSVDGGGNLDLALHGTVSGAVNTASYELVEPGEMVTAVITLQCNRAGQIENWPAFWLNGTVRSWPAWGEIDIAEGLWGHVAWHYIYANAAGQRAQAGGTVAGDWCGRHTYAVDRGPSALTFYYDGRQAGRVTSAGIGVPLAQDPMTVLIDYGQGSYGGPDASPAGMTVSSVTITHDGPAGVPH